MSEYDLMKLFSSFDGEVDEGDFTPEELREYLEATSGQEKPVSFAEWKRKYFE